jgi:hypothetical protein
MDNNEKINHFDRSNSENIVPIGESVTISSSEDSKDNQSSSKTKKYLSRAALGLIAAGGAFALANQPSSTLHEVENAAPVVGAGAIGSEILWDAGALMMVAGVGESIGNPLTVRKRWNEISKNAVNNRMTKAGLTVNTIGALSLSGFMIYGGTKVSPELWPGVAGVVALDVASTVALRAPLIAAMRNKPEDLENNNTNKEAEKLPKPKVRTARLEDIERLVELDLRLFRKAYGQDLPPKAEVYEMLKKRYLNNPKWMFVADLDGVIEGFVSAFPTNVSKDEFISWENSTANGTLDGKVNHDGKYAYVTNMTLSPKAVKSGAEEMLLGNLVAMSVAAGIEYGYFVSRIPLFKVWASQNNINLDDTEELKKAAEEYVEMRRPNGKRRDPELGIYEELGYSLERTVENAFQDEASLDFGVVCKAEIPFKNKFSNIKSVRAVTGLAVKKISNHPKLLKKLM